MSAEMYSEVFSLFRLNESGMYICLICEQNIFADLELEPHALEDHLLNIHDLTLQPQDNEQDDLEIDNNQYSSQDNDIESINQNNDLTNLHYNDTSISRKRKYSADEELSESYSSIMEIFDNVQGSKFQCKECGEVIRRTKHSLRRHLLQHHGSLYKQLFGEKSKKSENEETSAFDKSTVLAWMGHVKQRRQAYNDHIKNIQRQLDEKYDIYKQIGKDIDYLNEELDQYRITWLKEQKRIETITNYIAQNKNDNQSTDPPITILEEIDDDLKELLASQPANNDEENINDVIASEESIQQPSERTKLIDCSKPIFKVRFAERSQ